ncbi:MAG TPA: prepilin peptidase [Vicinamibacteria bacterium]|nr:prepilin peptidase [Vicinamibacteria bacterium]
MPTTVIMLSAVAAGYCDVRWRRIPNWLVAATIALCLASHGLINGVSGLRMSAAGLVLGIVLLFPLFLLRGMGAGDVKYFGAIGAGVTYQHVFTVLVISLVISGLMSLYKILKLRRIRESLSNIQDLINQFRHGHLKPHPVVGIDNEQALLVPFTLASALSTWLVILFVP